MSSLHPALLSCPVGKAVVWLREVLSAGESIDLHIPGATLQQASLANNMIRAILRRVPFECKRVLAAIRDAAILGSNTACDDRDDGVSHGQERGASHQGRRYASGSRERITRLLKVVEMAEASPLLPLPATPPQSCQLLGIDAIDDGGGQDAEVLVGSAPLADSHGTRGETDAAIFTAGMLLDAFTESPANVVRAMREALKRR